MTLRVSSRGKLQQLYQSAVTCYVLLCETFVILDLYVCDILSQNEGTNHVHISSGTLIVAAVVVVVAVDNPVVGSLQTWQ